MCGNHRPMSPSKRICEGSPPRVREPPDIMSFVDQPARITPACAGTTRSGRTKRPNPRDHPRVCGNHSSRWHWHRCSSGSPPRVREPHDRNHILDAWRRITPACAGTTLTAFILARAEQDHPRVCGNHLREENQKLSKEGSPPRVREPLGMALLADRHEGITPACAGTTRHQATARGRKEDHPRVCGNHHNYPHSNRSQKGSPPRVREPLKAIMIEIDASRITPACAGTTQKTADGKITT